MTVCRGQAVTLDFGFTLDFGLGVTLGLGFGFGAEAVARGCRSKKAQSLNKCNEYTFGAEQLKGSVES
ncbi:hypothetical protein GCM10012280_56170 [Wenjunlia tyrosinilytica]|uniref:Uncharacterized protein n=1 Tax=Wenjunlia tyrosinilytica TaxID=1544741 RepID=A0A917ZX12_9ACTN|nr:hypothetical protein GCM10012280_56170 [Wenjunlia tyrosinilytica]